MKCPPCKKYKCKGEYDNRHMCDGGDCNCVCQITVMEEIVEKGIPIIGGVALIGAGAYLTVKTPTSLITGGVAGGLTAAGVIFVGEPIQNWIDRERVDYNGMSKRALRAGIVGGISGGIAGGLSKCKKILKIILSYDNFLN